MRTYILAALSLILLTTGCERREQNPGKAAAPTAEQQPPKTAPTVHAGTTPPPFMEKQALETGGQCNMETINARPWNMVPRIDRSLSIIEVTGWAVDIAAKKSPNKTFLRLQDQAGQIFYGEAEKTARQDVADYFKEAFYKDSGYQIKVDVQDLPDATYDVVVVMDVNEKSLLCSSGQKLEIATQPSK